MCQPNDVSLQEVLYNRKCLDLFAKFCCKELGIDNLLFIFEYHQLLHRQYTDKRLQHEKNTDNWPDPLGSVSI